MTRVIAAFTLCAAATLGWTWAHNGLPVPTREAINYAVGLALLAAGLIALAGALADRWAETSRLVDDLVEDDGGITVDTTHLDPDAFNRDAAAHLDAWKEHR